MAKRDSSENKYKIIDDYVVFYAQHHDGTEQEVKFSLCDLEKILALDGKVVTYYSPCTHSWYARISKYDGKRNGKNCSKAIRLHKYIMGLKDSSRKYCVDHINHDTLDNRRENLRIIEWHKNTRNRSGANANSKTGCRNVCFVNGRYQVQLMVEGKNKILGKFNDLTEADSFAKEMREKYYGEFAGEG